MVSSQISGDSYQSSRWPRDNTSWMQEIAAERLRKPIQSSRAFCRSGSGNMLSCRPMQEAMPTGTSP